MSKTDDGRMPYGRRTSMAASAASLLAVSALVAGVTIAGENHHHSARHAAQPSNAAPKVATLAAATAPLSSPAVATSHSHHVLRAHKSSTGHAVVKATSIARATTTPVSNSSSSNSSSSNSSTASQATGGTSSSKAPPEDTALVPKVTYLAAMLHKAKGYSSATAKKPFMKVPKAWYGRTSVMPVLSATADRVQVRLARRPNQSTVWIPRTAVQFGSTNDALVIDLSERHIYMYRNAKQIHGFPIGEGRPSTPTPTGNYFVAFHAPGNNPESEYGKIMLETSAHSTVFKTFEGGNDAIIAIHGPIGSDTAIGTHGARISNGCIRMHMSQLKKIVETLDGSPLFIVK